MSWKTDDEYQTKTIAEIRGDDNGYTITFGGGWSLGVDERGEALDEGDTVRTYGAGIGHAVRGIVRPEDEYVVYYRSPTEQRAKDKRGVLESKIESINNFLENKNELDQKFDSLPGVFRRRIERFRANNEDFRWEYEPYELACCEAAVQIASEVRDGGHNVREHVRERIESLDLTSMDLPIDSGNQYGFAKRLAFHYVLQPEMVVHEHGAMTPIVGCEKYGCHHSKEVQQNV